MLGLLRRYRVDRRLPPPVLDLYTSTAALRTADVAARTIATGRGALGSSSGDASGAIARLGSNRLHTAGDLSMSTAELAHVVAGRVSEALHDAEIDHFVTDRCGDTVVMGVALVDRAAALEALSGIEDQAWYLEWEDGRVNGIEPLPGASRSRRVRRARSWKVFRAHRWGDRVVGHDQGTRIDFWDPGTSGLIEKVGTRSQERFDARSPATVESVDGRRYPGRTAFPVGSNLEHMDDPIDIVYTWVDGADPDWVDSFRSTASQTDRSFDEEALDPARYRSRDELRYSLRSVWAYCGWVRKIWIVTAGQRPTWLVDHPKIEVVDHTDILPASALPTFNSHAIESALHEIDRLAEHFVYFNDDVLVARPVRPELFFTSNGLPRVFQSDARPPGYEDEHTQAVDASAMRGRELLAEHFGRVATGKPYHCPFPLTRRVMREVAEKFAEKVDRTRHSRFRSPTDLSIAASFAQHYALGSRHGVLGDISTEYVNVESGRLDWHLDRIRLGDDIDTFCINETADAGGDHVAREETIREFFEAMYPVAAPWESSTQ